MQKSTSFENAQKLSEYTTKKENMEDYIRTIFEIPKKAGFSIIC